MSTTVVSFALPDVHDLAELGRLVDEQGLSLHLTRVRALVRTARSLGISPVLCQVALDPAAPEVVRERAVARLIRRVAAVSDVVRHEHAAASA